MLVQRNNIDSPIQDCAHVSQVRSATLYDYNQLTYQIATNTFVFYVLGTKRLSKGFGDMLLSFINKANLFSLTVMFLEWCTYKFHENAFKLMPLSCLIKLLISFLVCKLELFHDFEMQQI